MELQDISQSFGKMSGLLTFLFLIFGYLLYTQKEAISKLIGRIKKAPEPQIIEPKEMKVLLFHPMFTSIETIKQKIHNLDFTTFENYDHVKTKLLKKLIDLKLDTINIRLRDFIQTDGLSDIEPNEMKFNITGVISKLVNDYNDEALRLMVAEYKVSKGDAKYLIKCYESFRVDIMEAFTRNLSSIVMDDNYDNNFERLNTILYTLSMSLEVMPADVTSAFNEVNGRFKKYESKKKKNNE